MAREPDERKGDASEYARHHSLRDVSPHPERHGPSIIAHWDWDMFRRMDARGSDSRKRAFAEKVLGWIEAEGPEWPGHNSPARVAYREKYVRELREIAAGRHGARSPSDVEQMRRWVEANADAIQPYAGRIERNPALWWSYAIFKVEQGVVAGDENAIRVAFKFVCDDQQTPFGRGIKSSMLKKLKHVDLPAWKHWLPRLRATAVKFDKDDYKPREYNDLIRLIRRMEEAAPPTEGGDHGARA